MITKEQFIGQFTRQVNPESDCFGKTLREAMKYEETVHGVKIYRCLNLLLIELDGNLYAH